MSVKLPEGLMDRKKVEGVTRVVQALIAKPLRDDGRAVIHSRKITVVVDAECVVTDGGVAIYVNGKNGPNYQNYVSDDLVSFLAESAKAVEKEIVALKDKDDVALIAKSEALAKKIIGK